MSRPLRARSGTSDSRVIAPTYIHMHRPTKKRGADLSIRRSPIGPSTRRRAQCPFLSFFVTFSGPAGRAGPNLVVVAGLEACVVWAFVSTPEVAFEDDEGFASAFVWTP